MLVPLELHVKPWNSPIAEHTPVLESLEIAENERNRTIVATPVLVPLDTHA